MIKCFVTTYRVRLSMLLNRWVYYFQKIPLIKRLLPDSLFGKVGFKDGLSIFMIVGTILLELLKKAFYVIVVFALAFFASKSPAMRLQIFIQLYIFFSVFCGTMNNFTMFLTDETRRMFIKIIRFDSPLYIKTQVYSEYILNAVFLTPCIIIAISLLGGNPLQAIGLVALGISTHLLMDLLQMKIFKMKRTLPFIKRSTPIVFLSFVVGGLGLFLSYNNIVLDLREVSNWFAISLVWAIPILFYIRKFSLYTEASQLSVQIYDHMMSSVAGQNVGFQDVVIRDKDITDMKTDKKTYGNRKGYDYLNAVFFHRQKRVFYRPIRNRLMIISVASIGIILIGHFSGTAKNANLNSLLPYLVFVMYFLSVGSRACRSLFYNCDVSLLDYSFYRRKEHVLRNFTIRVRYLIGYNLIPAIVLCIYVMGGTMYLKVPYTPMDLVLFVLTIIMLSVLFSVHYLFLYYVFQPYTRDFSEKNPINSLLNTAMYFICFAVSNFDIAVTNFVLYILIFTIAYVLVALFCVYRFAPKTFRIR